MRRISKSSPPSDVLSDKQPPPRTMNEVEADFLAELPSANTPQTRARAAFDDLEKRKLRAVMYQEQGSLCVYCERQIVEAFPVPRIDHWIPLSNEPELALQWRNLYLSCPNEATCDAHKEDDPLRDHDDDPDLPWPADHAYELCVGFTSLGEMYVRTDAPLNDAQRRALVRALGVPHDGTKDNGILNLNHPSLVAARNAAVNVERKRMERDYKGRAASRTDREVRAERMLGERPLQAFVSIRVGWLRGTLGRAR